ncbi:energy-coupling factor transporter transmembrane protein EcfT [Cohnella endophytica]|uniref:Energy-coupling factor transporter transmembrane protein EcfT n=2 Tax=Cohnella endophytica TaxID=2419778 RepID=A0A494XBY4_9BACL|nr:energy-coupling factor transporter transmembrane protein EcfT [Cohnella endophytica]
MLAYAKLDSPIHRLTGAAKLLFFALWSMGAMITFDTRFLVGFIVFGLVLLKVSRVRLREYSFLLYLIGAFFLLNHVAIYLFSPLEGVKIYGTKHVLLQLPGRYDLTAEQLFYQLNIALKYLAVIPIAFLFILTTDPGEFAASLNRVKVSYKIAYAVSIALRYIPDIQRDFQNISFSAQARGVDISAKEKLGKRLRNVIGILMPLILSSIERIETISAAMELRGFGRGKRRTWYKDRPFGPGDYGALAFIAVVLAALVWLTIARGSRFYNVFESPLF